MWMKLPDLSSYLVESSPFYTWWPDIYMHITKSSSTHQGSSSTTEVGSCTLARDLQYMYGGPPCTNKRTLTLHGVVRSHQSRGHDSPSGDCIISYDDSFSWPGNEELLDALPCASVVLLVDSTWRWWWSAWPLDINNTSTEDNIFAPTE